MDLKKEIDEQRGTIECKWCSTIFESSGANYEGLLCPRCEKPILPRWLKCGMDDYAGFYRERKFCDRVLELHEIADEQRTIVVMTPLGYPDVMFIRCNFKVDDEDPSTAKYAAPRWGIAQLRLLNELFADHAAQSCIVMDSDTWTWIHDCSELTPFRYRLHRLMPQCSPACDLKPRPRGFFSRLFS
jgi:hypothetical protein